MSKKNTTTENDWPSVNSIILLSPGTRLDCGPEKIAIIPNGTDPIYGVVVDHIVGDNWRQDRVEVLVDNEIHQIMRTPSSMPTMEPYFNVMEITDVEQS